MTETLTTIHRANGSDLKQAVRAYWNGHIHDLEIVRHPVGTLEFFDELADYRFDKLRYLPRLVPFDGFPGQRLLEVGCGTGIDLVRFAIGGARVTGVDLSGTAIDLARKNFALRGLPANLQVMDGERLGFPNASFDVVYAHGVLQYTPDPQAMIREIHRVLRPGGEAILMVYNRYSWLNALSGLTGVGLEHADAPVLRKYSRREFERLLEGFRSIRIDIERFPVRTRLHSGFKARVYNGLFVRAFETLPRNWVRPLGWHIMALVTK